jgi:hypothetical protein
LANFDREQLRAILTSAGIDASKKNIRELDLRLSSRQCLYWAWKEETVSYLGPSKELLRLRDALMKWMVLCFKDHFLGVEDARSSIGAPASPRHRAAIIRRNASRYRHELRLVIDEDEDETKHDEKCQAIIWLINAACEAVSLLEAERSQRRRAPVETILFWRLYEDYCYLSGDQTLSDTAPSIRFVKECVELIAPEIIVPAQLRQRIEYAPRHLQN